MRPAAALLAATLAVAAAPSVAQENNDLDLIPKAVQQGAPATPETPPAPPPRTDAAGRLHLEDAVTAASVRGGQVVPLPPPRPFDWQNRTSLDGLYQWDLGSGLTAALSDRLNATEESDVAFPTHRALRNDFREGFLTWEPEAQRYLEAGRINLRSGVALGFNPTDFFKTRTQLDQASLDPSVIREDRLGSFMARGQAILDKGSLSLAFAPKLDDPEPLSTGLQSGFGGRFGRTNGTTRLLATLNYDLADLNPQALLFRDGAETRIGANLSRSIGQSIIAYGEWAGGRQGSLIDRAIAFGKATGTIPQNTATPLPSDSATRFRNDLAVGFSWTSEEKITVNLEYHYHQGGFSRQDWHDWFALGGAARRFPPLAGELWFIRGFAADQEEPIARQEAFLRADWTDAFIPKLELGAIAFVDLYDGSTLTQLSASYFISDTWTVAGFVSANLGGARSERGSLAQAGSAIFQLIRYF